MSVLIDFIGTPGSGKSTISHEIALKLKSSGFTVSEPTYNSERAQSAKARIIKKLTATVFCTLNVKKSPLKIFKRIDKSCFSSGKERFKQYVNLCHVISSISACKKSDFIIADQGIAQAAVSLCNHCDINRIPTDIVSALASKANIAPTVIYITTGDIKRNLDYLASRSGGASRVDKIKSDEGKIAALLEIQSVIDVILTQCGEYMTFVTDKPLDCVQSQTEIAQIIANITC